MKKRVKLDRLGYVYVGKRYRFILVPTTVPCTRGWKYDVLIRTEKDPLVVGRELDLKYLREELLPELDKVGPRWWYGDRATLEKAFTHFWSSRKTI